MASRDRDERPSPTSRKIWSGGWTIDPAASEARFSMTYLILATLEGRFGTVEGTITIDDADPARSSVVASIDVRTLDTGSRLRDKHLRSGDFFDAARFPSVTFRSACVEATGDTTLRVHGALTIRGVTQDVALDTVFEGETADADGMRRARFTATAAVSRRAFGLGRRTPFESTGVLASDRVTVTLGIGAVASVGGL